MAGKKGMKRKSKEDGGLTIVKEVPLTEDEVDNITQEGDESVQSILLKAGYQDKEITVTAGFDLPIRTNDQYVIFRASGSVTRRGEVDVSTYDIDAAMNIIRAVIDELGKECVVDVRRQLNQQIQVGGKAYSKALTS